MELLEVEIASRTVARKDKNRARLERDMKKKWPYTSVTVGVLTRLQYDCKILSNGNSHNFVKLFLCMFNPKKIQYTYSFTKHSFSTFKTEPIQTHVYCMFSSPTVCVQTILKVQI